MRKCEKDSQAIKAIKAIEIGKDSQVMKVKDSQAIKAIKAIITIITSEYYLLNPFNLL
ncbi:hypothetical protein ISS30_07955 [bacterium]|nr:hypothetical protein [FCB group bacterium]MBL7191617.1 hypothetical protein [bacterium]